MDQYSDSLLKHLNVEFKSNIGSLYFYDSLSFGTIRVINDFKQLDKIFDGSYQFTRNNKGGGSLSLKFNNDEQLQTILSYFGI
jgi:hypothetical protein